MATTRNLLLTLGALEGVRAWGVLGHATVAYVAQNFVTASTKTWAQGILGDTSDTYLASIASWADDYRETTAGKWSAPFHFIDAEDNPPTSCSVEYERDCGTTGCSVSAIANYTTRVDGSVTAEQKTEALKFLVHFIGDITQPLHDEAYEVGGNDITVTFDGYDDDNLHSDWDTYMPEKLVGGDELSDAETWAANLTTGIKTGVYKSVAASWISGDAIASPVDTAMIWAKDANAFVCTVVMPNGAAALQKGDLYPTYYDSVIPTIEMQIAKGGYRLANWLNLLAASAKAKRGETLDERDLELAQPAVARDWMPRSKPLSKAQLARAALEGGCGCNKGHSHKH
jgi:hypothetical protein